MTDDPRLRRAERAALLSVACTCVVIVGAAALLIADRLAPAPAPQAVSVTAEQYVLIDEQGHTRGSWEVGTEGPYLSIVGEDGRRIGRINLFP